MHCIICPKGCCPTDCPFVRFFPAEVLYTNESVAKTNKLLAGMKMDDVRKRLSDAYKSGGVDAAKALVDSWTMEFDAREKYPILGLSGIATELLEKLNWYKKNYGPLPAAAYKVVGKRASSSRAKNVTNVI